MIKKKFLLPGECFFEQDPYLIGALLGPGHIAVALHVADSECGGMVNFFLQPDEKEGLLGGETSGELEKLLEAITSAGLPAAGAKAVIFGAEGGDGPLSAKADAVAAALTGAGITDIERDIRPAAGLKIYFKNWDNSLRVIESEKPGYCIPAEVRGANDPIKVLIVDDSSLVQNILSRMIGEDDGFTIVGTASEAFSAGEKILETDPHLIILDVIMPQINGISFLQNLMRYHPKPVIIFSTLGKTGGQIEKQARASGAVDVVDKKSLNLSDRKSIDIIKEKIREGSTYMVMRRAGD